MKRLSYLVRALSLSILAAVMTQLCLIAPACAGTHSETGTQYGIHGVKSYATQRHGPDGDIFLDPYFLPFLEQSKGLKLVDVGCGAGPWAIYAARHGAKVSCIDIQPEMIDIAKQDAKKEKVYQDIQFAVGDAADLPYSDQSYDHGISINVGCNIPSSNTSTKGLNAHFGELARVIKPKGRLVVTAPASFDVVFSRDQTYTSAIESIKAVLNQIPVDPQDEDVVNHLNQLDSILRATFKIEGGQVKLVENEMTLKPGDKIWRKIPGLTVPNYYHSESEYMDAASKSGFKLVKVQKPTFENLDDWYDHLLDDKALAKLSQEYVTHNAFVIYEFEKA